jgi:hypothetical protein
MSVTFRNQISIGLLDLWSWEFFWSQEPFGTRNLFVGTFLQEPFCRNLFAGTLLTGTFWSWEPFSLTSLCGRNFFPRNLLSQDLYYQEPFLWEPF